MCVLAASVMADELHMDVAGRDLQVTLSASNTTWVQGTTADINATLTNTGQVPLMVDTFGELNGVYEGKKPTTIIVSCWTLSWGPGAVSAAGKGGRAPLDVSQFIRLAPGQSYITRLFLKVTEMSPGTHHLKLAYAPRVASPSFSFPEHWLRQHGITEPIWVGMIISQPVTVDVVAPPVGQ